MSQKIDNSIHPLFLLIVLFYSLLAVAQSSDECGTCTENEKLRDLSNKFDLLEAEMKSQKEFSISQKTEIDQLKSEIQELKSGNVELISEVEELKAQLSQQGEKNLQLEKEISKQKSCVPPNSQTGSCTKKVGNAASKKNENSSSRVALDLLPTSCDGLRKEGHFADGIYLVLDEETNKISSVLCRFSGAGQVSENFIGQIEVKTSTVHFYVQRESYFDTPNTVIPFDVAPLNEGGAFNLALGIFTAPVPGIYHFEFSAVKANSAQWLSINLKVNDVDVGIAWTYQPATGSDDGVSLSASLRLAAGDRVNLFNNDIGQSILYDDGAHFTHFTGWLVEEDLM